jgi:hypothetical protein
VRIALAALLVACLLPRTALAGRTFYGWLYGTEVMPERGVELQTWVLEVNDKQDTGSKESSVWWAPLVGVTDQLQLSLPVEWEWLQVAERTTFTFRRFGIEAHYRMAPPDSPEGPQLVPLLRLAVKRDVSVRNDVRLEADIVASYESGPVHVLADVGFIADVAPGTRHTELRPAAGVSVRVAGDLRIGAEVYSELSMDSRAESWAVVGPNLAWTHGRFWLSASFGIGVYQVSNAPRVVWGIAF